MNYQNSQFHEVHPPQVKDSWTDMYEGFTRDMGNLWQRQSQLVGTELNEKATVVKSASGMMITGGVILFVGFMCLAATAVFALSTVLEMWVSSAIVTAVLLLAGLILVKSGQSRISTKELIPRHSLDALSEIKMKLQEKFYEIKRH